MIDLPRPGDIGIMEKPIYPLLQLDERSVIDERADLALDLSADGIFVGDLSPGIYLGLLDTERDLLAVLIYVEAYRLYHIPDSEYLGGMTYPLGPRELRDMDETFYAFLEFDKRAVRNEVNYFPFDPASYGILGNDLFPRVRRLLFEAEGKLSGRLIDREQHHLYLVSDSEHLARMGYPAP